MTFDLKQSPELTDLSDSYWTGKIKLQKLTNGTWGNAAADKVLNHLLFSVFSLKKIIIFLFFLLQVGPANNFFYTLFSDQVVF